jgi:hypothetical protein
MLTFAVPGLSISAVFSAATAKISAPAMAAQADGGRKCGRNKSEFKQEAGVIYLSISYSLTNKIARRYRAFSYRVRRVYDGSIR